MRCCALLLIAAISQSEQVQSIGSSSPGEIPRSTQNGGKDLEHSKDSDLNLPVSLTKIREQLLQPLGQPLRGVNEEIGHIVVEIQKREELPNPLSTMDFESGPTPPEGPYAHELQRITQPPTDHPLEQPYASFSTSELLTIVVENIAAKYVGVWALNAVSRFEREHAEEAARDEVRRAMLEFCRRLRPRAGGGHFRVASGGRPSR